MISGMNGKGDKRRPEKPGAYQEGYEAIDWSKGRPARALQPTVGRILSEEYGRPTDWVIPPLEEILGPSRYGDLTALQHALDEHKPINTIILAGDHKDAFRYARDHGIKDWFYPTRSDHLRGWNKVNLIKLDGWWLRKPAGFEESVRQLEARQ